MGAWGYKPFENDNALDWLSLVETPILAVITETFTKLKRVERTGKLAKLRGNGQDEAIAAAALLAELSKLGSLPSLAYEANKKGTFDRAVKTIKSIHSNDDWINEWRDPKAIRLSLNKLIAVLVLRKHAQAKLMERVESRMYHGHRTSKSKQKK